jgi:hypothetical protein
MNPRAVAEKLSKPQQSWARLCYEAFILRKELDFLLASVFWLLTPDFRQSFLIKIFQFPKKLIQGSVEFATI